MSFKGIIGAVILHIWRASRGSKLDINSAARKPFPQLCLDIGNSHLNGPFSHFQNKPQGGKTRVFQSN